MKRPNGHDACAECGGPAPHRMLCPTCAIEYGEAPCDCHPCRSDLAGVVPCDRRDNDHEQG